MHRAFVVPLLGAVVGFCLTTASAATTTSRPRDAANAVERAPANIELASRVHAPATLFDIQRRSEPTSSSALAHDVSGFAERLGAPLTLETRANASSTSPVARGYDANAPPRRLI
jgi:hypothetical protein